MESGVQEEKVEQPVGPNTQNVRSITSLDPSIQPNGSEWLSAVVTLIWPFSSSTRTAAILLAEHDFRLRRNKGQVRVQMKGPAATALNHSHLSIGDSVQVQLDGGSWVKEGDAVKTPGRCVDGELFFFRKLLLRIERNDGSGSVIDVNEPDYAEARDLGVIESETFELPYASSIEGQQPKPSQALSQSGLWSSPAFVKTHGHANESLFLDYDRIDEFEEDFPEEQPRKRTKFWRPGGNWRFARDGSSDEKSYPATPGLSAREESANSPEELDFDSKTSSAHVESPLADKVVSILGDAADDTASSAEWSQRSPRSLSTDDSQHEDSEEEIVQMPPPPLPRLQIEESVVSTATSDELVQDGSPVTPSSPTLEPVPSPGLPLVSPFPASRNLSPQLTTEPPAENSSVLGNTSAPNQVSLEPNDPQGFDDELLQERKAPGTDRIGDQTVMDRLLEPSPHGYTIADSAEAGNIATSWDIVGDERNQRREVSEPAMTGNSSAQPEQDNITYPREHRHEPEVIVLDSSSEADTDAPADREIFEPETKVATSIPQFDGTDDAHILHEAHEEVVEDASPLPPPLDHSGMEDKAYAARTEFDVDKDQSIQNSGLSEQASDRHTTALPPLDFMTPQNSQNPSFVSQDLNRRVDDILDGRMPPTPQATGLRIEMVEEALQVQPERADSVTARPFNDLKPNRRSSRLRRSSVPQSISSWFTSMRQSTERLEEKQEVQKESLTPLHDWFDVVRNFESPGKWSEPNSYHAFRTPLSYYIPLSALSSYLNVPSNHSENSVDVLAVVAKKTAPSKKSKKGPKDWNTSFFIADPSSTPNKIQVQVFRPIGRFLPIANRGDLILLRNYVVKSNHGDCFLLSGAASGWHAWRFGDNEEMEDRQDSQPIYTQRSSKAAKGLREECRGPPVELGLEEREHAMSLRDWWVHLGQYQVTEDVQNGVNGNGVADAAGADGTRGTQTGVEAQRSS